MMALNMQTRMASPPLKDVLSHQGGVKVIAAATRKPLDEYKL